MEKARQVAAGAGEVIGKGARVVQDQADEGHWVEKAQGQAQKVTKSAKQCAPPGALAPHPHPHPPGCEDSRVLAWWREKSERLRDPVVGT